MKKNLGISALILIILHFVINAGYREWITSKSALNAKYRSYFEQRPMPNYVFIGDSHFQNGINPAFIPRSFNLATSAENYILNYYKLQHLLQHTTQKPTHIFLSLGLHSFSVLNEELLLERQLDDIYWSRFVQFADLWRESGNIEYLKLGIKSRYFSYTGKYSTVGKLLGNIPTYQEACKGFISSSDVILNQPNWAANARHRVYYQIKSAPLISTLMLNYFQKIQALCKSHQVELVLIKMPLSGPYLNQLEQLKFNRKAFEEAIGVHDYHLLDYQDLFRDKPTFFSDADHLNETGAGELSRMIAKDIQREAWKNSGLKVAVH